MKKILKTFDNVKDLNEYLKNNAKDGEEVCLDERATISHSRRKHYFKRLGKSKLQEKEKK